MLRKLILAVAFCLSLMPAAQARIYYLPDYQRAFLYGSRIEQSNTSPHTTPTCNTYGLYSATSRPSGAECTLVSPVPGLSCYRCTICANTYIYNSSNCTGEYVLSGSSCAGKYNKCICNPTKYATTADGSGCDTGQKADTSTSCVDKTTGKTLYTCIADPCYGLADNTSELGCDKYYDQCPSKCQLGSTCKPTDCSAYTLTSCPSGSTCKTCTPGCGDNAKRYKKFDGLAFQVNSPAKGKITFTITGSNYQIDWGDGTIDTNKTHTYTTAGLYDIEISGDVKTFSINSGLTAKPQKLYSLNLPKATKITLYNACPTLTGTIPPLPNSLNSGEYMFQNCSKLTGKIPTLPTKLTNGQKMFQGCSGLTGTIPKLPNNLSDGSYMFYGCSGLTGHIPDLPSDLTDGTLMFARCSGLTGNIPDLPSSLTEATAMFSNCDSLSGSIPGLPRGLTHGNQMFYHCNSLSGNIPELPKSLTYGLSMFDGCSGLTGNIPDLPSSLTNAGYMFSGCSKLTGNIPELPSGLTYGYGAFEKCTGLTGSIPELPNSLTQGYFMFSGCTGLTGQTPVKPSGLSSYTSYTGIFRNTKVTNDGSWPDSAW